MMAPAPSIMNSSATPTQRTLLSQDVRPSYGDGKEDGNGLRPHRYGSDGRSLSSTSGPSFAPRSASLAQGGPPGSFSSDMRSTLSRSATPRPDLSGPMVVDHQQNLDETASTDQAIVDLKDKLSREIKIKEGSENLLEALNVKKAKQTKDQRSRVELELNSSNRKIGELKMQIAELQRPKEYPAPARSRMSSLFRGNYLRAPPSKASIDFVDPSEVDEESESPTYVLAEILQSLETEGMNGDFYVERANSLVELFKRHPNLKYDLAWSVFGLRVQMMLLSDSKEVIAAGYRMTRYAITDRKSLQTMRELNTDYLVVLSLVKEGKANVEREQALKFVRAFLDVKHGILEVSRAVARTLVAVAEQGDDRLRAIAVETLAEILIRDPSLVVSAGGIGPLTEVIGDGNFGSSESLVTAFLYLYDTPKRRKYLGSGLDLDGIFSTFTDSLSMHGPEHRLKHNAKVIAAIIRSWTGLMIVCMNDFRAIRSLVSSLQFPAPQIRNVLIDLFFDLLRIKPPSWSSSFLAGRRLTTYGRVGNLKNETSQTPSTEESSSQKILVDHYTALLLAVLLEVGMLQALLNIVQDSDDQALKRKATLLISEVLKISSRLLPAQQSAKLQMLPGLFSDASKFGNEDRFIATSTVYQIDSVNKTLVRSGSSIAGPPASFETNDSDQDVRTSEQGISKAGSLIDESQFRSLLIDSQVLNHGNYTKWRWDVILNIVEGPLSNPKRLDEAIKGTKFIKRLVGFYRPFKYRFANVRNTKPNQRYIKVGCALMTALLKNPDGVKYLAENKLLRQIAECLAQFDPMSGLTSPSPVFSPSRLTETLSHGYFEMLGALSSDSNGLLMLERWRMINMCYHIIELRDRPDLAKMLLRFMDYSLDSHFRVMLSKALTASSKEIRIFSTNLLRKYTSASSSLSTSSAKSLETAKWAIQLLVTQLYDPDVEVCETAVKLLEEACNRRHHLEYVVKCRPALDHLGEIGAPLLLRFLSTSVGYHYLDDLDYITQEMDDWFLGRNDTYVTIVEASLSRAMEGDVKPRPENENTDEPVNHGDVPPHFYRELTRTEEGCKLLREKGHFTEFVSTIRDNGMESNDSEIILKVKGCLWAVGNVGSMTLGGPFLEESDVVSHIVKIAEHSDVMTLRGTAFFVLGLLSRSLHGIELLDEFGWDSSTSAMGDSLGFCLPLNLSRLFSIKPWQRTQNDSDENLTARAFTRNTKDDDPINSRILALVTDLGNTVLTKKSVTELMRIKSKKPAGFSDPQLFSKVMTILECHHFRLPVRRFIIDLFDKTVMRRIVLDEEESEGETEMADDRTFTTSNLSRAPGGF